MSYQSPYAPGYDIPFPEDWKVLEIGGGANPLRPGQWTNLDARALPQVDVVADILERLPFEDASFDGIFNSYSLEHISWRKLEAFIREMRRVLKPNGCGVFFTANLQAQVKKWATTPPDKWDWKAVSQNIFGDQDYEGKGEWVFNSHFVGFSPAGAGQLFKACGFGVALVKQHPVSDTDMIIEAWCREPVEAASPQPAGLKLNIGSYVDVLPGWRNIDILPVYHAIPAGVEFMALDATQGLPFEGGSVLLVYSSHMIEHVPLEGARAMLRECYRVMKPGGVIRLATPDLRLLATRYLAGEMKGFGSTQPPGFTQVPTEAERFSMLAMTNHVHLYDEEHLKDELERAGFKEVRRMQDRESRHADLAGIIQKHLQESLIMEGVR